MRDDTDDLELRRATADDARAIAGVYLETWRATYEGIVPAAYLAKLSVERLTRVWKKSIAEGELILVAAVGPHVLGFTSGGREREADPFFRGEIFTLYVDVAAQRHGVGAMLLLEMLRELPSPVLVWVLEENHAARAFYEALGGMAVRRREEKVGGVFLPEVGYGYFDVG